MRDGGRRELVAVKLGLSDTADGRVEVEGDLRASTSAARETFRSSGLKEQRAAMLTVAVQEYIADVRPVFGERTA